MKAKNITHEEPEPSWRITVMDGPLTGSVVTLHAPDAAAAVERARGPKRLGKALKAGWIPQTVRFRAERTPHGCVEPWDAEPGDVIGWITREPRRSTEETPERDYFTVGRRCSCTESGRSRADRKCGDCRGCGWAAEDVEAGASTDVCLPIRCVGTAARIETPRCPDCGGAVVWAEAGGVPGTRRCIGTFIDPYELDRFERDADEAALNREPAPKSGGKRRGCGAVFMDSRFAAGFLQHVCPRHPARTDPADRADG